LTETKPPWMGQVPPSCRADWFPACCGACTEVACNPCNPKIVRCDRADFANLSTPLTTAKVCLEPDGRAAFAGFANGDVAAWFPRKVDSHLSVVELSETAEMGEWECVDCSGDGRNGTVRCLSVARNSNEHVDKIWLAAGHQDGTIARWSIDVADLVAKPKFSWKGHAAASVPSWPFSGVEAVAASGSYVFTGGQDSSACVWRRDRSDNYSELWRMHGAHGGAVTAVDVYSNEVDKVIATSAGEDGLVKLWQPRNYKGNDFVFEEDILPLHHRDVELASSASPRTTCMELDAPHRRVCTGSGDGVVRLWDIVALRATRRFEQGKVGVTAVAFDKHQDVSQIASGRSDGAITIWDVRIRECVESFAAHSLSVLSVSVLGHLVLSASLTGTAALWDLRALVKAVEVVDLHLPLVRNVDVVEDSVQNIAMAEYTEGPLRAIPVCSAKVSRRHVPVTRSRFMEEFLHTGAAGVSHM